MSDSGGSRAPASRDPPATPPALLAAGVLFWGWQTGYLAVAIAIALLIEAPRWMRTRLELAENDFNRIADFTTWLFVGVVVYLVATHGVSRGVITAFQWLPGLLLPIVAAQRFSRSERINLTALLRLLRHLKARGEPVRDPPVDLSWAFLALCLIAAGAANQRGPGYFTGVAAIVAWALWSVRPAHVARGVWVSLVAIGCGLGYAGHIGLSQAQSALESMVGEWLLERFNADPYRTHTRIGHVGELKQSSAIIARLPAGPGDPAPPLLHRASYNLWSSNTWIASGALLARVMGEADGKTWLLSDQPARSRTAITAYFEPGRSLMLLPPDTVRIAELAAIGVARNRLGAVQSELEGGWIGYVAYAAQGLTIHAPPDAADSQLPGIERELFDDLVVQLGLRDVAPREALERTRRYFGAFSYSAYRAAPPSGDALAEFVTHTRSGHCEYFAAATTLLLRAAGIPARYATGYAVLEHSERENAWLVRQRHAHAWTRAWIGGRWIDFDTTPGEWFSIESGAAPAWEAVMDWLRWVSFRWSQRNTAQDSDMLWWSLGGVLALVLAWRLSRYRTTRDRPAKGAGKRARGPGWDSEFYALERRLAARGWPRAPAESASYWAERVAKALPPSECAALAQAARLHERYRFDPAGLGAVERATLRALCGALE